jgi:CHAD domain-containing protein
MPGATYRYALLRKRLNVFTRMLHGVERGDVRALHRVRVASRRLRELLPVLQLDRGQTHKLVRRLRKVTDRLGTVREADVMLLLLAELHDPGRLNDTALRRVTAAVIEERDRARDRLAHKLPTPELRRLADKLDEVAQTLDPAQHPLSRQEEAASRWAMDARIAQRADRLHRAMQEAGAVYLPDRLHGVRIAMKKLRYAVELRDEFAGVRAAEDLRTLRRGQDVLGRMHDLQVLINRARHIQARLTPADTAISDELDQLIHTLEDDCRRLHGRYMRDRPALTELCARATARPHAATQRRSSRRQVAS